MSPSSMPIFNVVHFSLKSTYLQSSQCIKIFNEFKSTATKLFFSPFSPLTNQTMKQILQDEG